MGKASEKKEKKEDDVKVEMKTGAVEGKGGKGGGKSSLKEDERKG